MSGHSKWSDIKKEKIRVAPPYEDRRSKEFEVTKPDPLCPRCGIRTTWYETEVGELRLWCMNCGTNF